MRAFISSCVALTVAMLACDQPVANELAPIVRVENGVEIVENRTLAADSLSWRFDTVPDLIIGMADGPEEYLIGRLAGYLRRSDGSVLVGDATSGTVRLFDDSGKFIAQFGRSGDGPGEYRVLQTVAPHLADSLLVIDYEGNRGTILTPRMEYVRSFRIRLQDGREESLYASDGVAAVAGDGHLVMYDYLNTCGRSRSEGFCEDSMTLFKTELSGAPVATLGRFVYKRSEARRVRPGHYVAWGEPHPQVFWFAQGDKTYYADARRFEVLVFGADGTLSLIIRAPHQKPNYSRADLWPKPAARNIPDPEAARILTEAQSNAAVPDSLPQFSDLLVDSEDNIWLREYVPPGRPFGKGLKWYVFSPEGHLSHVVRSPFDLFRTAVPWLRTHPQIGSDHVLTSKRDADGVEYVVQYSLMKN